MTRPRAPRLRNATDAESLSLLVARARGARALGTGGPTRRGSTGEWPESPWASA
jgi:hypothetical protein